MHVVLNKHYNKTLFQIFLKNINNKTINKFDIQFGNITSLHESYSSIQIFKL